MRTYKILGLLLTYPNRDLWRIANDLREILRSESLLPAQALSSLDGFLRNLKTAADDEQMFLQATADYVALFDRTRAHSLHLLEHVYGESRERGQAMVDLTRTYEAVGLYIKPGELPDYLPLFLEYLSHLSPAEASDTLAEAVDVIAALAVRLRSVTSSYAPFYAAITDATVALSRTKPQKSAVRKAMESAPKQPANLHELDEEWREREAFAKDAHDACGGCDSARKISDNLYSALRDSVRDSARDSAQDSAKSASKHRSSS